MVTAIILMKIERGKINEVAEKLVEIPGISEVYSVSGRHDLVAIARVANNEKLSSLVTGELQQLAAIQKTETMLALQSYSRHVLETMFTVGADGP